MNIALLLMLWFAALGGVWLFLYAARELERIQKRHEEALRELLDQ